MILPFQTKINGKLTNFVEKIIVGLYRYGITDDKIGKSLVKEYFTFIKEPLPSPIFYKGKPKIHTIREDKHNRWQVGKMIDFYINNRTKKAFRFAPRVPVIAVQDIGIHWYGESRELTPSQAGEFYNYVEVVIDPDSEDYKLLTIKEVEQLAKNDGFDSVEDFFAYFNNDFKGKIIHWTNLKY